MDASHPLYLAVQREIPHMGSTLKQRMHIPHEAVAFVIEDGGDQARQQGVPLDRCVRRQRSS